MVAWQILPIPTLVLNSTLLLLSDDSKFISSSVIPVIRIYRALVSFLHRLAIFYQYFSVYYLLKTGAKYCFSAYYRVCTNILRKLGNCTVAVPVRSSTSHLILISFTGYWNLYQVTGFMFSRSWILRIIALVVLQTCTSGDVLYCHCTALYRMVSKLVLRTARVQYIPEL